MLNLRMLMDEKKVNYGLVIPLAVTLLGWAVTFGVCQNKIENNTHQIERLEQNQSRTDMSLQQISSQLAGLNAKMDLLIDGHIIVKKD